jgi:hypothetical protein
MLVSTVAAGAIYSVWERCARIQHPVNRILGLAASGALISVAQQLFRPSPGRSR